MACAIWSPASSVPFTSLATQLPKSVKMLFRPSMNVSPTFRMSRTMASSSTGANCSMASGSLTIISPSRLPSIGMALASSVDALSTISPKIAEKSASGSASATSRLSHDAFMALNDPCIVVEASCAVVPVMPSSVCMTWIASYTSERLFMSYLTPDIFSASFSSRSISERVPP